MVISYYTNERDKIYQSYRVAPITPGKAYQQTIFSPCININFHIYYAIHNLLNYNIIVEWWNELPIFYNVHNNTNNLSITSCWA